jgi:hypothetical protein
MQTLIKRNLEAVEARIADACARSGRRRSEVVLMAVTKTHGPEVVETAAACGLFVYGENRVQETAAKRPQVGGPAAGRGRWELIGNLQSNKARLALEHFQRIQSVDRPKLVKTLARLVEEGVGGVTGPFPILLQVNAGDDPAKFGCAVEEVEGLLELALENPMFAVEGLMTIAPLDDDPAVARRCFARLREVRDRLQTQLSHPLPVLSMGMTGDLEVAIEEGSTLVRVGSALFGTR